MLEARKKISKKQIKEDKLVTTYYKAISFYQKNQARLLIGLGVVALVVVAVILFSNKKANDNKVAAALLAKVMPLYNQDSFKQAIDGDKTKNIVGLKEIVDKYGSTDQGETAKIFLADCYSMMGNTDAAYKMYDDYSGSVPLFKASAAAGKAGYYEDKKEFGKAADLYKEAAKISKANPSNADYFFRAGINYFKAGQKSDAKTMFDTIKKDYKTSMVNSELDRYLVQIES